jgi:hypothetical protein
MTGWLNLTNSLGVQALENTGLFSGLAKTDQRVAKYSQPPVVWLIGIITDSVLRNVS